MSVGSGVWIAVAVMALTGLAAGPAASAPPAPGVAGGFRSNSGPSAI
jgi:hypothetical protein